MPTAPTPPRSRPRIAISACLMGQEVRFNGGHKASSLCRTLQQHFDFVPFCPEMAIGLSTPREAIRLVERGGQVRAVNSRDGSHDHTEALDAYGAQVADQAHDLDGFIFMQKSPSCGLERVKVYTMEAMPRTDGRGIFAARFCDSRPELPVEEEGRLHDAVLRENFIARVYAHFEWQQVHREGLTHKTLTDFHARYKYLLMAHNPDAYRRLGRLLGQSNRDDPQTLANQYFPALMSALARRATRGTHSNVLQHLAGYLKRDISADERAEMQQLIGQYREGIVPLVVPLTLLKHHFRRHPDPYVAKQAYLQPHPEPMGLRNAI